MKHAALFLLTPALVAQSPVEARLQKDLAFLAGPERKGRGNGSVELDQAADYLAKGYESMGLKPLLQRVPYVSRITRQQAAASFGDGKALVWGQDLEAVGYSADADFPAKPLAFLGYGVQAAGYDDLDGLDLKGKVAVLVRNLPPSGLFAPLGQMERGLLGRAQRLQRAGAAAVIVLESEERPRPLGREDGPLKLDIPVLSMPLGRLSERFADLPGRLQKIQETGKPASGELAGTFSLKLALERHPTPLPNLVAVIPGSDAKVKGEYIVLGAHLDHLGLGERGSLAGASGRGQAHPGADDNASGSAMILELARALKARPPRRSVVVLHVSGEEVGLLGSAHWMQNPTVPLADVKFMLNFDMVGRLDPARPTLQIGGLGAPKSALAKAKTFAPEGLAVGEDLGMAVGGSDHMAFARAKIPTFFFFTGVHGDYHRPSDTLEKLNLKGMAVVTGMAEKITRDLADADQVPAFDPETAKVPTLRNGGPVRVAFGTLPDFAENPLGFRINGTSPGSAAESIGMKAGDVMVSFGGKSIRNLYDFQEVLSTFKPGDQVRVVWVRDGVRMEKDALLKGR